MKSERAITTRIAPSPTGPLHIGTARSALFNYLFAHKSAGTFILRIEDTDKKRSRKEHERDITEGLAWLGLAWDELHRQSEHLEQHQRAIEQLLENNLAYISRETNREHPDQTAEVVRLRNEGREVTFTDIIRGDISFETSELRDFVIARSVAEPLYHLAVVVDDWEAGVTHVIRGEDHISNTPRQILIQEALGLERPQYAHIPLILAPDRSKLSKRKEAASISEFREKGYLPEALVNYMALLGWNPGTSQELFTMQELAVSFALSQVQHGGAVFDEEKLQWFNKMHLKQLPSHTVVKKLAELLPAHIQSLPGYNTDIVSRLVPTVMERITTFGDFAQLAAEGEYDYFFMTPSYNATDIPWKEESTQITAQHLSHIRARLDDIPDQQFYAGNIRTAIWEYAGEKGRGAVLWPLRFVLSGKVKSPDPFTLAEILGKKETLTRISNAVELLSHAV